MELHKAEQLTWALMIKHDLVNRGWTFDFDFPTSRFGRCNYSLKLITLSAPLVLLNGEAEVLDVALHEIAHALCTPGTGHGPRWKMVCQAIGARPERCYDDSRVKSPEQKYKGVCDNGHEYFRRAKPATGRKYSCNHCSPRSGYDSSYPIIFTLNPNYK